MGGPLERLIIFTRYPEPGKTKTRLIPALGPQQAADLHRQLAEHALNRLKRLIRRRSVSIEICYEGGNERLMREWIGSDVIYRTQRGQDLGERMAQALREALAEGAEGVVLVGTDCPGLTAEIAEKAFHALNDSDIVLGPASDGGYYLVGLKRMVPELFTGISWGSAKVLEQTVKVANSLGLSTALVDMLDDVDRVEDLHIWEKERTGSATQRISVIIPTLNEAPTIAAALAGVRDEPDTEIIVVDGGSADGTSELAKSHGVKTLISKPGRALQMNSGAAAATGGILVFLHADTRLPEGFGEQVRKSLGRPGVAAGAFQLRIDAEQRSFRILERFANWRSEYLQMPYGDQALFLRAELFHAIGGFPEIPIMEDFEFVRRIRRKGRIVIVPSPALTSARRWLAVGTWRTTLINQLIVAAYYAGVSTNRLARWHRRGNGE